MSLVAPVVDGAVSGSASAQSVAEEKAKSNAPSSTMDKESFLQLLVAQMKYQDPMQPTDNTEYVGQLAQFSELEQMQNMSASMNLQRASGLVGQYAVVEHVNASTGATTSLEGTVDSITYENNKAYVNIEGESYPIDEVVSVVDPEYATASNLATEFSDRMNMLPGIDFLSLGDREDVETLQSMFNSMNSYQQSYISDSQVQTLQEYVTRMSQIVAHAEAMAESEAEEEESGSGEETEASAEA